MRIKGAVLLLSVIMCLPASCLMGQTNPRFLPNYTLTQDTSAPPPDYVPVEKEPQIIRQAVPTYPEVALKDSIEGRIIVKLWVDKDGKPHQVIILKRILEAGGKELQIQGTLEDGYIVNRGERVDATVFDQPTIDAAMKYRFTPAIMNGRPVGVWVVIPFSFKLKPDSVKTTEPVIGGVSIIRQPPNVSYLHDSLTPPPDYVPVDKEPQIVKQAVPVYPEKALKDKLEGRVIVKLWINKEGGVNKAIILKSTDPIFNQATVDAAVKYKFTPAILHDKPVGVWVVIPFTFKLKPDDEIKTVDESASGVDYYKTQFMKTNKYWMSYQDMIKQYDAAMYFERMKDYEKALKSYEEFVKDSEQFPMRPEEMVRHAKVMIEKYSKMGNDGK